MKKNGLVRQFIRIVILLIISVGLLILILVWITPRPPTKEFKVYNSLLSKSDSLYSYDKESFNNADFFRKQAYKEWQEQNNKFFLKRDFTEVKRMILMAISILEEAYNNAKNTMETTIINTNSFIDDANFEHRILINRQKWEGWISDIIQHSKNRNTTVLIIDKQEHACYVIDNGKLVQDLLIEMGVNYLNDKNRKRDNATPEGSYYISSKKEDVESNNHKTILLNFPNYEDKVRFEKAFQNKEIPDLDVLTYKLSIHGNGGKGYNWTDGSIALSNENMDFLYSKVKIGTRVVIVGAAKGILIIENKEPQKNKF